MLESIDVRTPTTGRIFDRQSISLAAVILLTEAAISLIFFSLVQLYPAHLLSAQNALTGPGRHLLRAGAVYSGAALSAYGLAKLPGQPISGLLADRFGARRLLLSGLAVCLLVIAVMTRVTDVTAFVVACAIYGLAAAVIWPAVFALVGDYYHASGRGRITAAISGAQVLGSASGFAGGALLIEHAGFGSAFALAFALDLSALFLSCSRSRPAIASYAAADLTLERARSRTSFRAGLVALRSALSADLLLLSAILVVVSLAVSILAPDLRPYSAGILQIQYSTFALLLAIPAAAAVLVLLPSGFIADAFGRSLPMLVAAAAWPLTLVALTLTRSLPLAVLFATLAALAYGLGLPAWSASLIDLSTAGRRGLQVGFAAAVQGVGLAVGPAIGGVVVSQFGTLAPFRCSAALMLVVLGLTVVYRARSGRLYAVAASAMALSN